MNRNLFSETERVGKNGKLRYFFINLFLLFLIGMAHVSVAQSAVALPGNFQYEIGCPDDWQADCSLTALTETSSGIWEGTFFIPGGNWLFKVVHDNSWAENYGQDGLLYGADIPLTLAEGKYVHFIYSVSTHLVDISFPSLVKVVGSFQSELGCAGDWLLECDATDLQFDANANVWYGAFSIPAGNYEYKIVLNDSWAENYGEGGVLDGSNIPLNATGDGKLFFRYDPVTHVTTTTEVNNAVTIAGDFQSELGCYYDWQPDCPFSSLSIDANGMWRGRFSVPVGNYEFKVTIDNSWGLNYGAGGELYGANIPLQMTAPGKVLFIYNPETHVTEYLPEPDIVVLPGSFQSELGCPFDWQPGCHTTKLEWDPSIQMYTGTFEIPAGYWEYKVALNNSWDENYGLWGQFYGPNIPLYLEGAATITFSYDPISHIVSLFYNSSVLCVNTFFDSNVNNFNDENIPMPGIQVQLSGSTSSTKVTDDQGKACFTALTPGEYQIITTLPDGFITTGQSTATVYLNEPLTYNSGMVCLGGANAAGAGFWTSKQGKAAFDNLWSPDYFLYYLSFLNLRNSDGSQFAPTTYDELKVWMQRRNSVNASYNLSAQLVAFLLNLESGRVAYGRIVYAPGLSSWWMPPNFMSASELPWQISDFLYNHPTTVAGDPARATAENFKNIIESANNNLNWVQLQPCNSNVQAASYRVDGEMSETMNTKAIVYPNPSATDFNVKFTYPSDQNVEIRVLNVNGVQVYRTSGSTQKELHFGDSFAAGLYFIEISDGIEISHHKVIKK